MNVQNGTEDLDVVHRGLLEVQPAGQDLLANLPTQQFGPLAEPAIAFRSAKKGAGQGKGLGVLEQMVSANVPFQMPLKEPGLARHAPQHKLPRFTVSGRRVPKEHPHWEASRDAIRVPSIPTRRRVAFRVVGDPLSYQRPGTFEEDRLFAFPGNKRPGGQTDQELMVLQLKTPQTGQFLIAVEPPVYRVRKPPLLTEKPEPPRHDPPGFAGSIGLVSLLKYVLKQPREPGIGSQCGNVIYGPLAGVISGPSGIPQSGSYDEPHGKL